MDRLEEWRQTWAKQIEDELAEFDEEQGFWELAMFTCPLDTQLLKV